MPSQTPERTYISLRLPRTLAAELKSAALKEANSPSAVARRLIATGLSRERRAAESGEDAGQ
jgi:hypothetical protein